MNPEKGTRTPRTTILANPAVELEVIPGLEPLAAQEAIETLGVEAAVVGEGRVAMDARPPLAMLSRLRVAVAAYVLMDFDVPRPLALLGHQALNRIVSSIREVRAASPDTFSTLRLSAAGADSRAFGRLKAELAAACGLEPADGEADLLIRIRRSSGARGWQVLIRTTPRPLSKRSWRVCDRPGALNATVASAMVGLEPGGPGERFINLACGSGTLLIERLGMGPARIAVGCDNDPAALKCAKENVQASGRTAVKLICTDARAMPFEDSSFDRAVVDLPYGMLVGDPAGARDLYPGLLREAARVTRSGGSLVAITARKTWLDAALASTPGAWEARRVVPIRVPYASGTFAAHIFELHRR